MLAIIVVEVGVSVFAYANKNQFDGIVDKSLKESFENIKTEPLIYPYWHYLQYEVSSIMSCD